MTVSGGGDGCSGGDRCRGDGGSAGGISRLVKAKVQFFINVSLSVWHKSWCMNIV